MYTALSKHALARQWLKPVATNYDQQAMALQGKRSSSAGKQQSQSCAGPMSLSQARAHHSKFSIQTCMTRCQLGKVSSASCTTRLVLPVIQRQIVSVCLCGHSPHVRVHKSIAELWHNMFAETACRQQCQHPCCRGHGMQPRAAQGRSGCSLHCHGSTRHCRICDQRECCRL